MKDAKELAHDYWGRPQPQRGLIPFIREVQADALRQGLVAVDLVIGEEATKIAVKDQIEQAIKRIK